MLATKLSSRQWWLPLLALLAFTNPFSLAQDNFTETSVAMTNDTTSMDVNGTMAPSFAPSSAPSMAPSGAPTWLGNISPECSNETASLAQIENLTSTLDALLADYKQQFDDACPFTLTAQGCSVSFGGETSYHLLCEQLGGQIYEHSVVLQCGIKPINTDYDMGVIPECIGLSCNATEIDVSYIESPAITEFGSTLDNGGCQGKVESGAHVSTTYYYSMLIAMVGSAMISLWTTIW